MTTEPNGIGKAIERILPGRIAALGPLFLLAVVLPVLCAIIYYGFIASDVYVSESRYVVRTQGKQSSSGLASLLMGADVAGLGGGEAAAAADFIASRDAMRALNEKGELAAVYARPEIDIFGRLGALEQATTFEDLYKYFSRRVSVDQDSHSGITALYVRAYRAQDAQRINERLLQLAEGLVNRLNKRSRDDMVRFARAEVAEARDQAQRARVALAKFRISNGVVDPEKQSEVSLEMISKLQDEIILAKTQLAQIRAFTPQNPQVPVLVERVKTLEGAAYDELQKLVGNKASLAGKAAEYTKLTLESEFSEKYLATALASLQTASNDARRQQAYVQRIVQPDLPDKPAEPRRLRGIFSVLVLGVVVWGVLTLLLSAMREHSL
ncbi:MAG: hypothetical protein J0I80_13770 [Sphingomonas sp.]|nr:hypothetical protein [Sphingomonas sp.]